jgi:hypothetical protein
MATPTRITDNRGRLIGYRRDDGSSVVYADNTGTVVARYYKSGDRTVTGEGRLVGKGDLGLMCLND